MRYILASASPRRKELLEKTGMEFEIHASTSEEKALSTRPDEICQELSLQKASDIYSQYASGSEEDIFVIGADTVVAYRGEVLGKPKDRADAYNMLSMLAGRTHQVYTGVTLMRRKNGVKDRKTFYEKTDVTFYPIDRFDLERYVATGDCYDKAGAYGIQGDFAIHVKEIHGDYSNVVGLPVGRIYYEMIDWHAV